MPEDESLQAEVWELEGQLDTCQDDLTNMTQQRENLASTLRDALNELDDLRANINTTDARAVLNENS